MIGLLISAALLGIIIAVLDDGDFPGWGSMIICVLAASLPAALVTALLPPALFFVGPVVGAVCGGFAISATCGMSVKRSCIAAGIYFAVQLGLAFLF